MKGSVLGRRFEYTPPRPEGWERADWSAYSTKLEEMSNWCYEQRWDHWGTEGNTFWFFYEKDYMLFMLRWT